MEHEATLRLGVFLCVLICMSALEAWAPRRRRARPRGERWALHGVLAVVGGIVGRLLAPVGAVAAATVAEEHGWGLLALLDAPAWAETLCVLVALDLAIYGQHVLFHRLSWLWHLHALHHRDVDLDATSGVRFHPLELSLSILWKALVIVALGASAFSVLLFEIILNASSIFHHANLNLPVDIDRVLRRLWVTPDMHRVHHSIELEESQRNFGFALPIWDRLFGTYLEEPAAGQERMELGVRE